MFKDKQRRGATINAEFLSGREKNRLVERCQLMKSLVYYAKDLIAAWKFISVFISLRFFFFLSHKFKIFMFCMHIYTRAVYNHMHVLVCRADPHYIFE